MQKYAEYLGWSVNANNTRGVKLFDFTDDAVLVEAPEYHLIVDYRSHTSMQSDITSANAEVTGHCSFGGGGFQLSGDFERSNTVDELDTEIVLVYSRRIQMSQAHNALTASGSQEHMPVVGQYIRSGAMICGFKLIVKGVSTKSIKKDSMKGGADANVLGGLIKAKLNASYAHSGATQSNRKRIEICGIGSFVPNVTSLTPENFEEDLNKLVTQFHNERETIEAKFVYSQYDIEVYARDKKYHEVLELINKLYLKLNDAVTPERSVFQRRVAALRHRVISTTGQEANTPEKLHSISKQLGDIICDMHKRGTCFLESPYTVCFGENCYMTVDRDRETLRVSSVKNYMFTPVRSDMSVCTFKLKTVDGLYIQLNEQPQLKDLPRCVLTKESEQASEWYLHADEDREGVYYLISNGVTLTYRELFDTPEVSTCGSSQRQRKAVIMLDDYLTECLTKIENDIVPIGVLLAPPIERFNPPVNPLSTLPSNQVIQPLNNDEEIVATKLVYKLLPRIMKAKQEELLFLLGNTGAGKSTLGNALIGHFFQRDVAKNWKVQDPNLPHMKMSSKNQSCTKEISTFKSERLGVNIADCPGFFDTEGEMADIAFKLILCLVREKARAVRGIVVVINISDLETLRGTLLINELNRLSILLNVKEKDFPFENIIFVVNDKRMNEHHKCRTGNFVDDIERNDAIKQKVLADIIEGSKSSIDDIFSGFEEGFTEELESYQKEVEPYIAVVSKTAAQLQHKEEKSFDELLSLSGLTEEDQKKVEDLGQKVKDLKRKLFLLRYMKSNYLLFSDINDTEIREQIAKRVQAIETPIPKEWFQNRLHSDECEEAISILMNWLGYKQSQLNRVVALRDKAIQEIERLRINSVEGLITYEKRFINSFSETLAKFEKDVRTYLEEVIMLYQIETPQAEGKDKKIERAAMWGALFVGIGAAFGALGALAFAKNAKVDISSNDDRRLWRGSWGQPKKSIPFTKVEFFETAKSDKKVKLVEKSKRINIKKGEYSAQYKQKTYDGIKAGLEIGSVHCHKLYHANHYKQLQSLVKRELLDKLENWENHFVDLKNLATYFETLQPAVIELNSRVSNLKDVVEKVTTNDSSEEKLEELINKLKNNIIEVKKSTESLLNQIATLESQSNYEADCSKMYDSNPSLKKRRNNAQDLAEIESLEVESTDLKALIIDRLPEYEEIYQVIEPLRSLILAEGSNTSTLLDKFCNFYVEIQKEHTPASVSTQLASNMAGRGFFGARQKEDKPGSEQKKATKRRFDDNDDNIESVSSDTEKDTDKQATSDTNISKRRRYVSPPPSPSSATTTTPANNMPDKHDEPKDIAKMQP